MKMEPIGVVRSCFESKFGVPRQPGLCSSAWGRVEFHDEFQSREAVRGLEGFSHIWLIFGFHLTADKEWHPTVRPPRLGGNVRVGVFASRSAFRPNPIGLSLVRLEGVAEGPVLHIGGIDLVDGTPVYDIKPYLVYAESIPEAVCGYAGDGIPRLEVKIADGVGSEFERMDERARRVIEECLSMDPRPAKGGGRNDREYRVELCGVDVGFQIIDGTCWITRISEFGRLSG